MGKRRTHSEEFEPEAVRLVREKGVTRAQASRDLAVHPNLLRLRVNAFEADPANAFPGHGRTRPEQLEIGALTMAPWRRGRLDVLPHHSDHGLRQAGDAFQRLLVHRGVYCSMSRSGNCGDKAAMESFFYSLKTEHVSRRTCQTRDEAKGDVFDYIERFYNPKGRHSTIGSLSPIEFEEKMAIP